jgi:hypothetical protein
LLSDAYDWAEERGAVPGKLEGVHRFVLAGEGRKALGNRDPKDQGHDKLSTRTA